MLTAGAPCAQAVAESMLARDGKSTMLRLLVPTPLCGAIIGKGGATIRSFAEDSSAAITVSPQDKQPLGIPDRVVRITGALPVRRPAHWDCMHWLSASVCAL